MHLHGIHGGRRFGTSPPIGGRLWLVLLALFFVANSATRSTDGSTRPALPTEPTLSLARYSNSALGFAVDYPREWQVSGPTAQGDPLARTWYGVEFVSDLYVYGEQAFGRYSVRVAVSERIGRTLTETVEYELSPIKPPFRDQIETRCCLELGLFERSIVPQTFPRTRRSSLDVEETLFREELDEEAPEVRAPRVRSHGFPQELVDDFELE